MMNNERKKQQQQQQQRGDDDDEENNIYSWGTVQFETFREKYAHSHMDSPVNFTEAYNGLVW